MAKCVLAYLSLGSNYACQIPALWGQPSCFFLAKSLMICHKSSDLHIFYHLAPKPSRPQIFFEHLAPKNIFDHLAAKNIFDHLAPKNFLIISPTKIFFTISPSKYFLMISPQKIFFYHLTPKIVFYHIAPKIFLTISTLNQR